MEKNSPSLATKRVPWPGPRPYSEELWASFYGRDAEVTDLINRVQVQKLTILLGPSGSGKTSLIRAGVVPLLRQERYHPRGDHGVWPVLLLRRWGANVATSLEESLFRQLRESMNAIRNWGNLLGQQAATQEADDLLGQLMAAKGEGSTKVPLIAVLEALARYQARRSQQAADAINQAEGGMKGGVILIFDQFEEQLRPGGQAAADALSLIGDLYESAAPTRVLLSMRQEFRYALRKLELRVRGLSGRSIYLKPLKEPTVIEVIAAVSKSSDVAIQQDVARRVVGWLGSGSPKQDSAGDGGNPEEVFRVADHDESGRPDMLRLQAVLLELCRFALGRQESLVDMPVFDDFIADFSSDARESKDYAVDESARERERARSVLGGALERWIEAAIASTPTKGGNPEEVGRRAAGDSPASWTQREPGELRLQVRRIAVRLAPRLSSGDYKISQEENTLFRQALGDDIAKLGIKNPNTRSRVRIVNATEESEDPPRLNWEELELSDELIDPAQHILSGIARVEGWGPVETGNQLVICFKETLARLANENVIQGTPFGEQDKLTYWELVHDQFGPCFTDWAERQRGTWDDCKSSLVVCSGIQPIAVTAAAIAPPAGKEFYELNRISWQGCGVESSSSEKIRFQNVLFKECFLVGTIFDAIDFVGCSFENCDLKGGLFRNCSFRADKHGRPTVLVGCNSNIAIVRGVIEALEFRGCHLHQPAIDGTRLVGDVRYTKGSTVIQGYFDFVLETPHAQRGRIFFDAESRPAFCLAGQETYELLRRENPELSVNISCLGEEFRVRS